AAFREASSRHHAFFCVEHVLYALLFDEQIVDIVRNCGGKTEEIRKDLEHFFDTHVEKVDDPREFQPVQTPAVQRVLQRAIMQAHSSGKELITGKDVFVAIFVERDSHAVFILAKQGLSRLNAIEYIAHGVSQVPAFDDEEEGDATSVDEEAEKGDEPMPQ